MCHASRAIGVCKCICNSWHGKLCSAPTSVIYQIASFLPHLNCIAPLSCLKLQYTSLDQFLVSQWIPTLPLPLPLPLPPCLRATSATLRTIKAMLFPPLFALKSCVIYFFIGGLMLSPIMLTVPREQSTIFKRISSCTVPHSGLNSVPKAVLASFTKPPKSLLLNISRISRGLCKQKWSGFSGKSGAYTCIDPRYRGP